MKIQYLKYLERDRVPQEAITNKVTIVLNEDVEISIQVNHFGELEVTKQQFGEGESSIIVKPSTGNQIRLS